MGSLVGPLQPPPDVLSSTQLHALFDILTHHETFAEVEKFSHPETVSLYGYPFKQRQSDGTLVYAAGSSAPLLAGVLRSIVLPIPGVRNLPDGFWHVRFQGILTKLGEADLSPSYDKGSLGTRKTLATAASVIHEAVSRGLLGGIPPFRGSGSSLQGPYDSSKAQDLVRAWEDAIHELVHGNLVDELFECAAKQDSLEKHSPAVKASVDYVIIHLATFIHHVLVLSPEGPYLLKLLENFHNLIPYSMIRQTLRVGNAATMINGMVRLLLAKIGVGALSNWVGLTQNADDGMNLLQRIISLVLSWDTAEFRKSMDRIERAPNGPSKAHLAAIRQFIDKPREEHDAVRDYSMKTPTSMVAAILASSSKPLEPLSPAQHAQCFEYYVALMAVHDRDAIAKVICRQNPDLFTGLIRDAVGTFDHMIRTIHEKIDLREHVAAGEAFITDLLNTSKPKPARKISSGDPSEKPLRTQAPSIEDYVSLLRRNRHLLYNWLHQFASQCPSIRDEFRGAAGALSSNLQLLYAALSNVNKEPVITAIDAHASYLTALERLSLERMQRILDDMPSGGVLAVDEDARTSRASICGPGMFLARWQQLLDDAVVTPETPDGGLRRGKEVKGALAQGKTVSAAVQDGWDPQKLAALAEREVPVPPDVGIVVEALGGEFRGLVVDLLRMKEGRGRG
ncbi:PX-associated-domain-containing protein [Schizothecium vesticola]|uniref:PX-associated-domain-containing protein n=1 Tax=Schizothecium vesticola TaxID=314040 RepID=A0AA40K2A5_9PEZI|nr:PX-associated-domain-containing protein [Schizothecium vesticola]